jgi:ankyrin repeat protein
MLRARPLLALLISSCALASGCSNERPGRPNVPSPGASSTTSLPRTSAANREQLFVASSRGDVATVRDLLNMGVDVNTRGFDGRTALMEAAYHGQAELAKLLLERGANTGLKKNDGETALSFAAGGKHTEIVDMISRASDLKAASAKGEIKLVQQLLDKGTAVNVRDADGGTALMEAVAGGHTGVVKLLLEKGADVNARKDDGATALAFAEGAKRADLAALLREKGAK